MGKIIISVIIPTFNRSNLLKKAIKSVQEQTFQNLEIIISDDGSTDNTKEIVLKLQKKDRRIKYVLGEHTGLPAVSRNKGIIIAEGSWIAFLDDDDYWDKEKLKKQINYASSNNLDFISTNAKIISNSNNKYYFLNNKKYDLSFSNLIKNNSIITSSVIVKKKIFENFLFDEKQKKKAIEDYDLWLKIASFKFKMAYLPEALVFYRDDRKSSIRTNFTSHEKIKNIIFSEYIFWALKNPLLYKNIILILKTELFACLASKKMK